MLFGNRRPRKSDASHRARGIRRLGGEELEDRLLLSIDLGGNGSSSNPLIATAPFGMAFGGTVSGQGAGWSVSDLGDVNGDGYDDFLVGAALGHDAEHARLGHRRRGVPHLRLQHRRRIVHHRLDRQERLRDLPVQHHRRPRGQPHPDRDQPPAEPDHACHARLPLRRHPLRDHRRQYRLGTRRVGLLRQDRQHLRPADRGAVRDRRQQLQHRHGPGLSHHGREQLQQLPGPVDQSRRSDLRDGLLGPEPGDVRQRLHRRPARLLGRRRLQHLRRQPAGHHPGAPGIIRRHRRHRRGLCLLDLEPLRRHPDDQRIDARPERHHQRHLHGCDRRRPGRLERRRRRRRQRCHLGRHQR